MTEQHTVVVTPYDSEQLQKKPLKSYSYLSAGYTVSYLYVGPDVSCKLSEAKLT